MTNSKPHIARFWWDEEGMVAADGGAYAKWRDVENLLEQLQTARKDASEFATDAELEAQRAEVLEETVKAYEFDMARMREQLEVLRNGCEQAELLLLRERFDGDSEVRVVRAVLRSALGSNPASSPRPGEQTDAAGICGMHGLFVGRVCPKCSADLGLSSTSNQDSVREARDGD